MNFGTFYGIGVGPGDPALLTFKAVDTIRRCDVIAVPEPDSAERTAITVVEEFLHGKELLECRFSMSRDEKTRMGRRNSVGQAIASVLKSGKSVGFITLGDPSIYSTYSYIRNIIRTCGFNTETVPGITSFSAAASMLDTSLCEGGESLHIIPASSDVDIEQYLDLHGVKVFMKSGKNIERVLDVLRRRGLSQQTRIVSRCTMENAQVFHSIEEFDKIQRESSLGYFSIILVMEK